jgi:hypothetical protein
MNLSLKTTFFKNKNSKLESKSSRLKMNFFKTIILKDSITLIISKLGYTLFLKKR